ncbi:MAG TPA: hypothetical protein DEA32_01660 [Firmicutes bacterium]|nr:hypothetical protein [Bacillota bacterium]
MDFSYTDIDWRALLVKKYKLYNLKEIDVVTLLLIDQLEKIDPQTPILSSTLTTYMTVPADQIDASLSRLLDKKLITYEVVDLVPKLSLKGLFDKLFSDLQKDILLKKDDSGKVMSEIHEMLLSELKRSSLSPVEMDKVSAMLREGATVKMMKVAIENIRNKGQNPTINRIASEVLRLEKEDDFSKEGYTARNEESRDDSKLRETLMGSWLEDGDKKK